MDRTILQWNAENWITVVLMVAIMYFFVGMITTFLRTNLPGAAEATVED